jgi:transposase
LQKTLQRLLETNEGRVSRLEVLEGPTGRRQWRDEVKARIVAESLAPGTKVREVADRHGIAPQHLTSWRRQAREGRLVLPQEGPSFIPLVVEKTPAARSAPPCLDARSVEIEIAGVVVRLPPESSAARIGAVVAALRGAA